MLAYFMPDLTKCNVSQMLQLLRSAIEIPFDKSEFMVYLCTDCSDVGTSAWKGYPGRHPLPGIPDTRSGPG